MHDDSLLGRDLNENSFSIAGSVGEVAVRPQRYANEFNVPSILLHLAERAAAPTNAHWLRACPTLPLVATVLPLLIQDLTLSPSTVRYGLKKSRQVEKHIF